MSLISAIPFQELGKRKEKQRQMNAGPGRETQHSQSRSQSGMLSALRRGVWRMQPFFGHNDTDGDADSVRTSFGE